VRRAQVHLILRHQAPNGSFEEKHLKFPPSVELDKGTHVYTAILYPSNNSCAPGPRCRRCRGTWRAAADLLQSCVGVLPVARLLR